MMFLSEAAAKLSFGDLCHGEIFFDAYLRFDAAALRERTVTATFLKKEFQTDTLTSYIPVNENVPALKTQQGRDFLLAHGSSFDTAICLSDDCEIATRLGRGGEEPSGRLLFAPVTPLKPEEKETLTNTNWGRMLLDTQVLEIRRAFSVAAEDVAEMDSHKGLNRRSLDDNAKLRLAVWWSAYACRRGPLVDAMNLGKLAKIAEAHDEADRGVQMQATLTTLAAAAWKLQGRAIELAGAQFDDHRDDPSQADWPQLIAALNEDFGRLAGAVDDARSIFQ
jgi:hypothetical protein